MFIYIVMFNHLGLPNLKNRAQCGRTVAKPAQNYFDGFVDFLRTSRGPIWLIFHSFVILISTSKPLSMGHQVRLVTEI